MPTGYYMNIRNKHVAHSVNSLEAHKSVVSLDREADGSLRVVSLGIMHVKVDHLQFSEELPLGRLARYAREYATEAFEDLTQRCWEKAEGLSQEQLSKLRPFQSWNPRELQFASPENQQAMKESRRGRNRKGWGT